MGYRGMRAALVTSAAICAVAVAGPAWAQSKSFNVSAQAAVTGIPELARQADIQILVSESAVRGKTTRAVRGAMSVQQALSRLLRGTGLRVTSSDGRTFTLAAAVTETPAASPAAGETTADATDQSDIVVTGSNIRGGSNILPVQVIARGRMDQEGYARVGDALRDLPQNFGGGASILGSYASNGTPGEQGVNLRGLGTQATLVLLNGHRLAPAGASGDFSSISGIPTAAIDRVEVLTDNASAIYGSDAVAGVVNIIMRKDFDGAESRGRISTTTDGGGTNWQLAQTLGKSWGSGNVLVSYEHDDQKNIDISQRDWGANFPRPLYLVPDLVRNSAFASFNQSIGPAVTISATGFYDHKVSESKFSAPSGASSYTVDQKPRAEDGGGTLGAHVDIGSGWSADVSGSGSIYRLSSQTNYTLGFGLTTKSRSSIYSGDASIGGPLFRLPGGEARIVLGVEGRSEAFATNTVLFGRSTVHADEDRTTIAGYAEADFPIVGPANEIPGVYRLSFDAAGRYERYSDFGGSFNPKLSVLWSPFRDLNLRGGFGTSYRAPTLLQLVNQVSSTRIVGFAEGPGQPILGTALYVSSAGNPLLGPEKSTSFTLGADYKPAAIPDLKLAISYYNIRYRGRIANGYFASNNDQSIYYQDDTLPQLNPPIQLLQNYVASSGANFNSVPGATLADVKYLLAALPTNLSKSVTEGLDFSLSYKLQGTFGSVSLGLDGDYTLKNTQQFSSIQPVRTILNNYIYGSGGSPVRFKSRSSVIWEKGRWTTALFGNYTGSYTAVQAKGVTGISVREYATLDFSLSFKLRPSTKSNTSGGSVTLAINNIFNEAPPIIPNSLTGNGDKYLAIPYDAANANPFGRVISLQFTKSF